ncbi:death-associated inhibitor of apoptosis 2 [Haematobia irritans]|uniref:death-associated inhibitor of apoptosis 2 n=1 Tax=Haematobia irritans TaxID=7368 RepID=UPI003F508B67
MSLESIDNLDLLIESNRLATFKNWPNPNISPESLAKAGFFYLNRSDEVKCAWCKGVIAQWEKHDDAFQEHRRFFPDCPRAQLGPLIEMASAGIRDLGIEQISPSKNPKFSSLDARLQTYTNWPIPNIQSPELLAQAGLYYQEVDDQVRCFHCNMGLRSWEKEDDPWFEHAKWYPMCQFVRLVKGPNYIQEVQQLTRSSSQNTVSTCMTIEEAMSTAPVKLALEMGIDGGVLRNETLRQLNRTGIPYATIEDLMKAVFDENERNEEQDLSSSSSAGDCAGFNRALTSETSTNQNNVACTTGPIENMGNAYNNHPISSPKTDDSNKQKTIKPTDKHNSRAENSNNSCISLEEENRKLKDARLCKICLDEEVAVVYLPCGHLVTCVQCAPGVVQCPMCRTTIKGFVRTFLS